MVCLLLQPAPQQLLLPHKYSMILRELFYIDPDTRRTANDLRYEPDRDMTTMHRKDTRKTRLTLRQINQLRKSSEAHILDQESELEFVHGMYATPPAAPA